MSTTDFHSALESARLAATKLRIEFDEDEVRPHDSTGLTFSRKSCEEDWYGYPCYVPRGRNDDDSVWASIEYSSGYQGFADGLYIVILAHAEKESQFLIAALANARRFFPEAYIKSTEVYMGCIH
jgi:hypothetical protein